MRTLIVLIAIAVAAPAAAQDDYAIVQHRDAVAHADAAAAQRRDVELDNRLSALEARQQTDRALRDSDLLRGPAPVIAYVPGAPVPKVEGKLASIPDDKLAASNARVREAAANRR